MTDEERHDLSQVLAGFAIHPLDQGAEPSFLFALIKYEDADGSGWVYRTSSPPNREELLGALMVQVAMLKRELVEEWE